MKKIYKKPLLTFIIGAIIFGTTGVLAGTFIAKDVTYDNSKSSINANNVQDAIDALYTKANEGAPESYTGSYTYTPNKNYIQLFTKDKVLRNNITINPIPDNYKDLSTATTATSEKILSGYTAYNNNGELITGNVSPDCISGSFVWPSSYSTNGYKIVSYNPTYFYLNGSNGSNVLYTYTYNKNINSNNLYVSGVNGDSHTTQISSTTSFDINNGLILKFSTGWVGKTIYYMICK